MDGVSALLGGKTLDTSEHRKRGLIILKYRATLFLHSRRETDFMPNISFSLSV